jgi:hypothetical protein
MTIYGAGVIGCEYASIMSYLDVKVNLVDTRDRLLSFLDNEITDALSYHLREQGVVIRHDETHDKVELHKTTASCCTAAPARSSRPTCCCGPTAAAATPRTWGWKRSAWSRTDVANRGQQELSDRPTPHLRRRRRRRAAGAGQRQL